MSKKICGIYKITNMVNGKVYIGQSTDIYNRWSEHKIASHKTARKGYALYGAINKYGIENFAFEIIEECEVAMLNDREIYYIDLYNSYVDAENSNGYNMTLGGTLSNTHVGNSDQGIKVYQYSKQGGFIAEYRNFAQAAKAVNLKSNVSISHAVKEYTIAGGFQWRLEKFDAIPPYKKHWNKKQVYQYDVDGHYMREFVSTEDAAQFVGCSKSLIELCCEKHLKTGKGYQWSYEKANKMSPVPKMQQKTKWKTVGQYTLDGELIGVYPCALIASEETGISLRIIQHSIFENRSGKGYVFRYIQNNVKGGEN